MGQRGASVRHGWALPGWQCYEDGAMTTNPDQKRTAADRAERLKAALRENLKRRKAQTRARIESGGEEASSGETNPSAGRSAPRKDR
jgi:hypothetical protein